MRSCHPSSKALQASLETERINLCLYQRDDLSLLLPYKHLQQVTQQLLVLAKKVLYGAKKRFFNL